MQTDTFARRCRSLDLRQITNGPSNGPQLLAAWLIESMDVDDARAVMRWADGEPEDNWCNEHRVVSWAGIVLAYAIVLKTDVITIRNADDCGGLVTRALQIALHRLPVERAA